MCHPSACRLRLRRCRKFENTCSMGCLRTRRRNDNERVEVEAPRWNWAVPKAIRPGYRTPLSAPSVTAIFDILPRCNVDHAAMFVPRVELFNVNSLPAANFQHSTTRPDDICARLMVKNCCRVLCHQERMPDARTTHCRVGRPSGKLPGTFHQHVGYA